MKQVKFLLVALMAVVMGVSVTSCMKGDDNTQVSGYPAIGKVKNSFLGEFSVVTLEGVTLKSKGMYEGAMDFETNDFVYLICSFDRAVDVNSSTNTINVTVDAAEKISVKNGVVSTTKAEDEVEEGAMYKSNRGVINISDVTPTMLDNYNLIMLIQYFAFEKIDKHAFKLVYYTDESEMKGKTDLKLYLRHTSEEEKDKEGKRGSSYKVFDLTAALSAFKAANDQKNPSRIIIEAEVNSANNDVPKSTAPTSLEYKFKE